MRPSRRVIDLNELSSAQRALLARRLHEEVDFGVIDGASLSRFTKNVLQRPGEVNLLQVLEDEGRFVGYLALRVDPVLAPDPSKDPLQTSTTVAMVSGRAAVVPAYRGRWSIHPRIWFEVARYKWRHPRQPLVLFSATLSPGVYSMIFKYLGEVYPNYRSPTPPYFESMMETFAARAWPGNILRGPPYIVYVGPTIRGEEERAKAMRHRNPHARYYLACNPRFTQGEALAVLAPLRISGLLRSAMKLWKHGARGGHRKSTATRARR